MERADTVQTLQQYKDTLNTNFNFELKSAARFQGNPVEMGMEEYMTPGEIVGKSYDYIAGPGTYLNPSNNTIYACAVGLKRVIPAFVNAKDPLLKY